MADATQFEAVRAASEESLRVETGSEADTSRGNRQ
jgi:hypothetical protein